MYGKQLKCNSVVIKYITSLIIIIFTASSFPQKDDASNFLHVGNDLFSISSRYDKKDFYNYAGVTAATSAAFFADEPIKNFTQKNKTAFLDGLAKIDKYYHIETMALSMAALYGYGWAADKSQPRELGLKLMESTFYSLLINLTTKTIIGRSRPYLEKGNFVFTPFNIDFATTAFPSGHTTLAFAYSTVMAAEYNSFIWKAAWYSAAVLVGGARIYHNVHWFSDVVMGAAIGYFVGEFVNSHHTNKKTSDASTLPVVNLKIAL